MTTHRATDDEGFVFLSPRYLAASPPEHHQQHLAAFATAHDWTCRMTPYSLTATSPCRRITMRHDRTAVGHGPHLVITARTSPKGAQRWHVGLAGNVPVEFAASLTDVIARGLTRDPDHLLYGIGTEPGLIELTVDFDQWEYIDDQGLTGFQSRDGQAAMIGRPPDTGAPPIGGDESTVWHLGAYPTGLPPLWAITFSERTPPFVVNAALADMLNDAPLLRSASSTLHPALAPLVTIHPAPARPAPTAPSRTPGRRPDAPGTTGRPRTR